MTNTNVSISPGRPGSSSLDKERREAARRLKERDEIRDEFLDLLNLPEEDMKPLSARGEEILTIANLRRDICRQIDEMDASIRKAAKQGVDAKELKALKKKRSGLYDRLNEFPELGYTRDEWEQADPSLKEKDIGRPKLRIEQRLNRAMKAYDEQEKRVRKLEKQAGVEHVDLEEYIDQVENPGVGRPRLDSLAKLDRRILKIDEEIEHIKSGRAQQEQDEAIKNRMIRLGINDPKKLPGRPMTDLKDKLAKLQQEKTDLLNSIAQQEQKLDDISRAEREVSKRKLDLKLAKRDLKEASKQDQRKLEQNVAALSARLESAKAELARIHNLKRTIKAREEESAHQQDRLESTQATSEVDNAPKETLQDKGAPSLLNDVLASEQPQESVAQPAVAKTETQADKTSAPAKVETGDTSAQNERSAKVRRESREHHRARLERERKELSSVLDEMLAQAGISTRKAEEQPQRKGISLLDKLAQVRVSNG